MILYDIAVRICRFNRAIRMMVGQSDGMVSTPRALSSPKTSAGFSLVVRQQLVDLCYKHLRIAIARTRINMRQSRVDRGSAQVL